MMSKDMLQLIAEFRQLTQLIAETAAKKSTGDEMNESGNYDISGYAGGNYDDCYQIGIEDGEIEFARHLQSLISKDIKK